jgi:DNA polymerase bacteriophage-type
VTILSIDIETKAAVNLKEAGVYKYVECPEFKIMLFSYKINKEPVQLVDLECGEEIPEEVVEMLFDIMVRKTAAGANFERTCLAKHFKRTMPPVQWECTLVKVGMLGLPMDLDRASQLLKVENKKDAEGRALIKYFCVPCKPTKTNGGRTWNLPHHAPDKWERFKEYNMQDVRAESDILNATDWFQIPADEKRYWALDQKINDRGVLIDPVFVKNAIRFDQIIKERLMKEAIELTGLENPNSVAQLKGWLEDATGEEVTSLAKDKVTDMLKIADTDILKRVLEIRQASSKSSVKKYLKMAHCICNDNRVRGLVQFYGANRTGRWAGRRIQVQNLPKKDAKLSLKDYDLARRLVLENDLDCLELLFGDVADILSQLIRSAFVANPNDRFIVVDKAAIEARVLAWQAGEQWRLTVFNTHGKIYEASASQMFKVPLESVTKGSDMRNKGKMSELALGYQGGPAAIQRIEISNKTPTEKRIPEEELPALVSMWRRANPNIVKYWENVQDAAWKAVEEPGSIHKVGNLSFNVSRDILWITLPSGRKLAYQKPRIGINRQGKLSLSYEGMNQETKKWERVDTYGGKLTENIVQAIARDLLAAALVRFNERGFPIVMHVHDEIVLEVPDELSFDPCELAEKVMSESVPWAKGLPLGADSFESKYYRKDG